MMDNGLSNVMDLIKRKIWEKLFKRRELMHIDAVKEFYARLTLVHFKKKEVARSQVRGVDIEFDNFRLASILGVPGHNGICEYIKDEIGKPSRVMMRHMSYVISVKDLESPYGDWMTMIFETFGVPLVDKQGEEPKRYDYFEETFLTMCELKRKIGVWWSGSGEKFFDAEDEVPWFEEVSEDVPYMPAPLRLSEGEGTSSGSTLGPYSETFQIPSRASRKSILRGLEQT
ncbi:hypothetical protein Dimus_036092 [Dionaea muscipula]